ncbi:MAG: RnfH family protein, partial [Gammaproteobacteria bacterium]
MNVGVAYADKFRQVWLKLEIPNGSTVREAIERSGILEQFPEIDLETQEIGVFGKLVKLTAVIEE